MQSANKQELYDNAIKMQDLIAELPEVEDVTSNLAITSPQVDVGINRDKAAAMQTDANAVESAFYDAYGQHWVSTIYAAVNEYKVLLELQPQYQADPKSLSLLYFKSSSGSLIPLDTLAKAKTGVGPQSINHYGQLNAVTISFDLKQGSRIGRRGVADSGHRRGDATLGYHHQFRGRRRSVPKLARQPVAAADRRHPGGLHRPGHPVRKLHSPADDSLRGCRRRASARW